MHPGNIQLFKIAGIDHASLANNHMLDWSRPGLEQTMKTLQQTGIEYSGAGKNIDKAMEPSILRKADKRILVFSYGAANSGISSTWAVNENQSGVNYLRGFGDKELVKIQNNIKSYRQPGDLVIISVHWGGNWGYKLPEEHREFAHGLIDQAGVDMIFGHSSHHPLGMEVYKDKLIIYGAGDFINDYEGIRGHEEYRPELSLMHFPEINEDNGHLISLKMIPMEIKKFRLNYTGKKAAKWLMEVLTREGDELGTAIIMDEHNRLWLQWN